MSSTPSNSGDGALPCGCCQSGVVGLLYAPDFGGCAPVYGCTDPTATNYNALATRDDGGCAYAAPSPAPLPNPFDFAVIRYQWTDADGTDLDTRTAVVIPDRENDVGWARNITDPVTGTLPACQVSPAPADTSPYYLVHGGDNCENGVEAVLANFIKLSADFPGQSSFEIRLRGFWYNLGYDPTATPPRDGMITVQFQTYLGGAMSHVNYDFVNTGGTVVDTASISFQLYTNRVGADVDGDDVATLVYDPITKLATIVPAPPLTPPVASGGSQASGLGAGVPASLIPRSIAVKS